MTEDFEDTPRPASAPDYAEPGLAETSSAPNETDASFVGATLPADWDVKFRERFVARMKCTLEAIAGHIVSPTPDTHAEMSDTVHKLVGIAGALGRPEISRCARELDIALTPGTPPPAAPMAALVNALGEELAVEPAA